MNNMLKDKKGRQNPAQLLLIFTLLCYFLNVGGIRDGVNHLLGFNFSPQSAYVPFESPEACTKDTTIMIAGTNIPMVWVNNHPIGPLIQGEERDVRPGDTITVYSGSIDQDTFKGDIESQLIAPCQPGFTLEFQKEPADIPSELTNPVTDFEDLTDLDVSYSFDDLFEN